MPLIYITGPSGAGKSSLTQEFIDRGYTAYDADVEICQWFDNVTHEQVEYPRDPAQRPANFQDEHMFLMSEDRIQTIKSDSKDSLVFILGQSPNDIEIADKYFGKVFCLEISEDIMLERLAQRTNNKYGKSPDQLAIIKKWYKPTLDRYRNYGAHMIDATQPLHQVANEIIALSRL